MQNNVCNPNSTSLVLPADFQSLIELHAVTKWAGTRWIITSRLWIPDVQYLYSTIG